MSEANRGRPDMPAGWNITKLENVIIRISNGSNATQYKEPIGLPISRIETISDGRIDLTRVRYLKENDPEFIERYCLQNGDILFSHINSDAHLGKTALYRDKCGPLIHGINLLLIRPSRHFNSTFLHYQFQYMRNAGMFVAVAQRAVNQSSINQRRLNAFEILVPPANEQDRIVAKIEELFSELDKGIEALTTAREQLKAYRQSVLKYAFEGKLTEKWRTQNPDKALTPASRLACIRAAVKARFEKSIRAWEANGKKGPKPLTPISYGDRQTPDFSALPPLPQGWAYVPFSELAYSIRNGISKKPDEMGPLRIFRISAVRPMEFDMSDFRRINNDPEFLNYRLQRGDIVFTRYNGSRNYVGVAALYRSDEDFVYPDKLIRCDVRLPLIDAGYIEKAVNCGASRAFIESRIRTTAGQAGISGADVKAMPVPICSVEEQRAINEIVEEQLSGVNRLETEVETRLAQAEAMRQSILKKAFSGQLVKQDAKDEAASVLLERIRAERDAATTKTQRKPKRAKNSKKRDKAA